MFSVIATDGLARQGLITLHDAARKISTPNMLLYTKKGGVMNLTPDLVEMLKPHAQGASFNPFHL
jgi:hypothetical protein